MLEKSTLLQFRHLPIETVAERLGLHVARHKSLCPFHDDHHASMSFSTSRNTFRCFVCGASGGTIDLVMRHLGKSFPEACRWLADANNVILEEYKPQTPADDKPARPFDASRYGRLFEHPWLSDKARRFLFEERRLNPRVVAWCRLSSWTDRYGTNWLQIPYFDQDGRLIGIQNRNLDYRKAEKEVFHERDKSDKEVFREKDKSDKEVFHEKDKADKEVPRFRFPYGSRCSIYNLPVTKMLRPSEPLYITEGASDCWAMLSAGHKAIAIPSATLLGNADKRLLKDLAERLGTTFHMFPDRDAPGERLFMQLKEVLPQLVHHQLPVGCKDFAEYYMSFEF
ncbi:CHC2 zinc finger domain-containing protein [uncultured Prevotella sp.]|uniref:CHC2 zinc finger domain-containing protein n=1 Tax=uncultured Prevotella sp. TaxID=159272 RepID=UPI0027E38B72|nr:CHC2 zinc finger domain-containing protein [uncultured Prevotella sp.]